MKSNHKKTCVLFVSIAFPPKSDSEGLQVAKYLKYLSKDQDLCIDVITSRDKTLFMSIDENLRKYSSGCRQIIKIPFFENKYLNFIQRKINLSKLNYPDSKHRFHKNWEKAINQISNKPDVIYSRSFPLSSAIMALNIQRELQVPWVLHLSDPWTMNPIHKLGDAKEWNENMERKCFQNATVISFTSKATVDNYSIKYPEYSSKMIISSNVFE